MKPKHGLDDEDTRSRVWRHVFLALGIIVVPVLYGAATSSVAFERSKSLEFCASCHVMDPFVEDLKNPSSDLLAAKHYQYRRINTHQCYACHADYDLFGPVKAKVNGLSHFVHNYVGTRHEIKLYKPFPNARCLQCHDGAKSFVKAEAHTDIMAELRSDGMKCAECHGSAHPEHAGVPK